MASPRSSSAPWRSGLEGARAHFWPGVLLQVVALALVLAYYHCPPVTAALGRLAELKLRMGYPFGMASTGIFAGLLPFLYLRSLKSADEDARFSWPQGFGLFAFWIYKGFEVELLYRILARAIGPGHDAWTIARKVIIDQFFYCPLLAIPATVLLYQWVEARYDTRTLANDLRAPRWYGRRVLPVLLSNLGVWLPATAIIYALPTPLQLPLENIVLCFFTLLIAHQTQGDRSA